jgi:hypothetical protein
VKRTGRDEPVGVVIHICMETTQGISLCSYLYLKLGKKRVTRDLLLAIITLIIKVVLSICFDSNNPVVKSHLP